MTTPCRQRVEAEKLVQVFGLRLGTARAFVEGPFSTVGRTVPSTPEPPSAPDAKDTGCEDDVVADTMDAMSKFGLEPEAAVELVSSGRDRTLSHEAVDPATRNKMLRAWMLSRCPDISHEKVSFAEKLKLVGFDVVRLAAIAPQVFERYDDSAAVGDASTTAATRSSTAASSAVEASASTRTTTTTTAAAATTTSTTVAGGGGGGGGGAAPRAGGGTTKAAAAAAAGGGGVGGAARDLSSLSADAAFASSNSLSPRIANDRDTSDTGDDIELPEAVSFVLEHLHQRPSTFFEDQAVDLLELLDELVPVIELQYDTVDTHSPTSESRSKALEFALERAMGALAMYEPDVMPEDWARSHLVLGALFESRVAGGRQGNLDTALEHYRLAMRFFDGHDDFFCLDWGLAQTGMARVHLACVGNGDRERTTEALECLERVVERLHAHSAEVVGLHAGPTLLGVHFLSAWGYRHRPQAANSDVAASIASRIVDLENARRHYRLALMRNETEVMSKLVESLRASAELAAHDDAAHLDPLRVVLPSLVMSHPVMTHDTGHELLDTLGPARATVCETDLVDGIACARLRSIHDECMPVRVVNALGATVPWEFDDNDDDKVTSGGGRSQWSGDGESDTHSRGSVGSMESRKGRTGSTGSGAESIEGAAGSRLSSESRSSTARVRVPPQARNIPGPLQARVSITDEKRAQDVQQWRMRQIRLGMLSDASPRTLITEAPVKSWMPPRRRLRADEDRLLGEIIEANRQVLEGQHSGNVVAVFPLPFFFERGQCLSEEPCIMVAVRKKGKIPVGDDLLPRRLLFGGGCRGVRVDVCEAEMWPLALCPSTAGLEVDELATGVRVQVAGGPLGTLGPIVQLQPGWHGSAEDAEREAAKASQEQATSAAGGSTATTGMDGGDAAGDEAGNTTMRLGALLTLHQLGESFAIGTAVYHPRMGGRCVGRVISASTKHGVALIELSPKERARCQPGRLFPYLGVGIERQFGARAFPWKTQFGNEPVPVFESAFDESPTDEKSANAGGEDAKSTFNVPEVNRDLPVFKFGATTGLSEAWPETTSAFVHSELGFRRKAMLFTNQHAAHRRNEQANTDSGGRFAYHGDSGAIVWQQSPSKPGFCRPLALLNGAIALRNRRTILMVAYSATPLTQDLYDHLNVSQMSSSPPDASPCNLM